MAQTLVRINDNNLRYMLDLRYADYANKYIVSKKYYIGEQVSTFDMLTTIDMHNIICLTDYTDCEECIISTNLNPYKNYELRL